VNACVRTVDAYRYRPRIEFREALPPFFGKQNTVGVDINGILEFSCGLKKLESVTPRKDLSSGEAEKQSTERPAFT
jgi:hypothetical protein